MRLAELIPLSTPGLVFAAALFMASFGPSLLPRGWVGQGVISGLTAWLAYIVGLGFDIGATIILQLAGYKVEVTRTATGGDWVLWVFGLLALIWLWRWSNRQHDLTASLVGLPDHPFWFDIMATGLALITFWAAVWLVHGLIWFNSTLTSGFNLMMPGILAVLAGLLASFAIIALVNIALFRQGLEFLARAADRANQRVPRGVQPPTSALRSGGAGTTQTWEQLGRRGQIFAGCGPDAEAVAAVTGQPSREPVRAYAGWAGSLDETVAIALAELERTGGFDRRHLLVAIPAGRGWVNEFTAQSFEYLTQGDCATVAIQYTHLASAFALVADRDTPRQAARAIFEAVEARIAQQPAGSAPKLYISGESLGSYGGHGAFEDADDMLARTDGAVWAGTPGFTEIWLRLTHGRHRGSPEITPVIGDGRHFRFATRPRELHEDAYGRPLEGWQAPRIAYLQHASDPMVWWNPQLSYKEPAWLRERAGRDVNPNLRWWLGVTSMQVLIDQLTSLDTPPGHGHIYEDDLVPMWAGVLDRLDAPIEAIQTAIRASVGALIKPPVG